MAEPEGSGSSAPEEPTREELREILKDLSLLRELELVEVLPLEEEDRKGVGDGDP